MAVRMRKVIRIGSSVTAIVLLVLTLACGATAAAVHQRIVPGPRLTLQLAGYRLVASPLTISGKPPKYFYSVWFFVTTYRPGSTLPTETGEQIMMLQLRGN
jgi:hypothetical protein